MRLLPLLPAVFVATIGFAADPPQAWAESPVVLDGANKDMREAILELLPDRDRPTTLFEAERIAEEAATRALLWLRSEGYYGATVTPEASEEPPSARLIIAPGPRFTFADPALEYIGEAPSSEADTAVREALAHVRAGAPGRAQDVIASEAAALNGLQQAGYADARIGERRVVVDHAAATVAPTFRLEPGAMARLGAVRAEPADLFREDFVARLRNWDEGAVYTPEALARLRRDMSATGAVASVSTELGPPDADGVRDVVMQVEPARRNAYEAGVSYSTTEGLGVVGEWTRRNFTHQADSLTLSSTLAEMQQDITAEWLRPHAAGLGRSLTLGAAIEREALTGYTRQGAALYASVDASNRLEFGTSYGARLSYDQYDDLAGGVSNAVVLSGFGAVRRNTTPFERRLDPRDGSLLELRLEPSISSGDETLAFGRAIAEGRVYRSFGREDSLTLAARIRTGWLEAMSGSAEDVPPDRRFYAGGGGSVRGYEYNSIYPRERDTLGLTPGGQGLLEGSIEARWRFSERWGLAAFVDGGNAFDNWSDAADLSFGAGVGVRYNLGFAPLRADIAIPLDDERSNADYALYISLGQAF